MLKSKNYLVSILVIIIMVLGMTFGLALTANGEEENQQQSNENQQQSNEIQQPTNQPPTDQQLSETEIGNRVDDIIKAFAKYYRVSEEEAAEAIYSFMVITEQQGGEYWLEKNGNLIFENKLTIEVKYNGKLLVNGIDIIAEQAQYYNLSNEDSLEIISALFELAESDGHFTVTKSADGVLFKYSVLTEITKDGMMIMDGQEIKMADIQETANEIVDEANEKVDVDPANNKALADSNEVKVSKISAPENNELPKAGENEGESRLFIGLGIVVMGIFGVVKLQRLGRRI